MARGPGEPHVHVSVQSPVGGLRSRQVSPPLSDLLQIVGGGGAIVGATIGFALRANSDRQLAENIALGSALGGVIGLLVAYVIWIAAKLAGA